MNITTAAELEKAVEQLHERANQEKDLLRNHFSEIIDSFKPVNLLRSTVKNISGGSAIATAAMGTTVAIGAGVFLKKIIAGKSPNMFKRLLGTLVELAVARSITKNQDAIAVKGIRLLKKITD